MVCACKRVQGKLGSDGCSPGECINVKRRPGEATDDEKLVHSSWTCAVVECVRAGLSAVVHLHHFEERLNEACA